MRERKVRKAAKKKRRRRPKISSCAPYMTKPWDQDSPGLDILQAALYHSSFSPNSLSISVYTSLGLDPMVNKKSYVFVFDFIFSYICIIFADVFVCLVKR